MEEMRGCGVGKKKDVGGGKRGKGSGCSKDHERVTHYFFCGNLCRNINKMEKQTEPPRFFPESCNLALQ